MVVGVWLFIFLNILFGNWVNMMDPAIIPLTAKEALIMNEEMNWMRLMELMVKTTVMIMMIAIMIIWAKAMIFKFWIIWFTGIETMYGHYVMRLCIGWWLQESAIDINEMAQWLKRMK